MIVRYLVLFLAVCLLLFSGTPEVRADPSNWSFDTTPVSGDITGAPGETVGWGYTISNLDDANWLVILNSNADVFENGTPDASIFDYPILAPGGTVTVPYVYDPTGSTGLYEFTWNPDTSVIGFANSGSFILSAEFWNVDPLSELEPVIFQATDKSAPYSVTATSPVSSVPEPATLLLLSSGLAGTLLFRRRPRVTR
jgi:hypothetical protein